MDPITLGARTILHAVPGDGDPPVHLSRAHALRPPFGSLASASDSEDGPSCFHSYGGVRSGDRTQQGSRSSGSSGPTELGRLSERAHNPKRAVGNLCDGAPSPRRPHKDSPKARGRRKLPVRPIPGSSPRRAVRDAQYAICFFSAAGLLTLSRVRRGIPSAVSRTPFSPSILTMSRPIKYLFVDMPLIPWRRPEKHAGRRRPRDMTFVWLEPTVNSKSRRCPKILGFGPLLRAPSKLRASVTGLWVFVWAPMRVAKVRMTQPLPYARLPVVARPVFVI